MIRPKTTVFTLLFQQDIVSAKGLYSNILRSDLFYLPLIWKQHFPVFGLQYCCTKIGCAQMVQPCFEGHFGPKLCPSVRFDDELSLDSYERTVIRQFIEILDHCIIFVRRRPM